MLLYRKYVKKKQWFIWVVTHKLETMTLPTLYKSLLCSEPILPMELPLNIFFSHPITTYSSNYCKFVEEIYSKKLYLQSENSIHIKFIFSNSDKGIKTLSIIILFIFEQIFNTLTISVLKTKNSKYLSSIYHRRYYQMVMLV